MLRSAVALSLTLEIVRCIYEPVDEESTFRGGFVGPRWILNSHNYCFVCASYIHELVSSLVSLKRF
jgi:hypothetical protein